jgi:hypothetical protein
MVVTLPLANPLVASKYPAEGLLVGLRRGECSLGAKAHDT